jgi:hypothetical protein
MGSLRPFVIQNTTTPFCIAFVSLANIQNRIPSQAEGRYWVSSPLILRLPPDAPAKIALQGRTRISLAWTFSDARNHVSWTTRQSPPQRRCIGRFL